MYFEKPGPGNTDQTLAAAYDRGNALGLNEVVVASTTGETAFKAIEVFKGYSITVVTYHCGFREPFKKVMPDDVQHRLSEKGVRVVSATHALSGVERSIFNKYSGSYPVLLIADTLRLFGQGVKVAVEVSVMAADAGALTGNDIIAIGGTGKGADAALVMKPAGQSHFFDMHIKEIICKPFIIIMENAMDFKEMGAKLGLEENEFRELVTFFIDNAVSDIYKFKDACQQGDGEKASASAHSLKGSSGNLGFSDIHELAKKAEKDSGNNDFENYETVASMIENKIEEIKKNL